MSGVSIVPSMTPSNSSIDDWLIPIIVHCYYNKTLYTWTDCDTIDDLFQHHTPQEISNMYQTYLEKGEKDIT